MFYAVGRRSGGGGRVCLIRFNAFEERGRKRVEEGEREEN